MNDETEGGVFTCGRMCWIAGGLFGVSTGLVLAGRFGLGTVLSIIAGLVVMAVIAVLLQRRMCQDYDNTRKPANQYRNLDVATSRRSVAEVDQTMASSLSMVPPLPENGHEVHPGEGPAAVAADEAAKAAREADLAEKAAAEAAAEKGAPAAEVTMAHVAATEARVDAEEARKAAAESAREQDAAERKRAARDAAAAERAEKEAADAEKAALKAAKEADKIAAANAPKAGAKAKSGARAVAAGGKPEMLKAPRAGGADDLKQIKGIGPKLEKLLNSMGVYHFDQIAAWRKKEVAWVDANLEGFKGRVSRDEWVKQARVLAKGGATEFSNRVKKGKVYKG